MDIPSHGVGDPAGGAGLPAGAHPWHGPDGARCIALAIVALQAPPPSLPTRAPEPRARAGGDHDALRVTPTGVDALCPSFRARNNAQTVHRAPPQRNACSARLRPQDHWWRHSPWVARTPTPVTRQYQACCCFMAYIKCPSFRPLGTPEALAPTS